MARILLAEPDRAIREFIAGILTEFGHDVLFCDNVVEAEVWLATSSIDALITDTVLHGEPGLDLSRRCAALGIPTITLTGREFRADQAAAARPAPFREKPFRFADLQSVLNAVETLRSTAAAPRHTSSAA
jgi:two-component system, cell cycle response regulator CpdR